MTQDQVIKRLNEIKANLEADITTLSNRLAATTGALQIINSLIKEFESEREQHRHEGN